MKKFLDYTGRMLLLVSAMMLMLHLLIPHDHHQEDFCINPDAPVTNHHGHSSFPTHCHVFNDLSSAEKSHLIFKSISCYNFLAINPEPDNSVILLSVPGYLASDCNIIVKDTYFIYHNLRAPPVS